MQKNQRKKMKMIEKPNLTQQEFMQKTIPEKTT